MIAEPFAARRQRRITGQRVRPGPASRPVAGQIGVEILAQRRRERPLIAGRGDDMVERPVAALPVERVGQRLRFRAQRGERGARGRGVALGCVPGESGRLAFGLSPGQRFGGYCEPRLGLLARGAGLGQGAFGIRRSAQLRGLSGEPRGLALGALLPLSRCIARRHRDPRLRLLGRLDRARLAERGFGRLGQAFGLDRADVDVAASRRRFVEPGTDRGQLRLEPRHRGGRVVAELGLAREIGGERLAPRRQLGDPPLDGIALRAQSRELVAELGRMLARRLGRLARGTELGRRFGLVRGGRALRLAGRRDRLLRRLGFAPRRVRRFGRLAPAGEDQPTLGDFDLVGKLAIALRRPRLTAQRRGAQLGVGEQFVEPDEIGLGRAQLLLGVLASNVQARDARRFLEQQPALGRLGRDDGGDLALADQGR